jgi:hypothetical protein
MMKWRRASKPMFTGHRLVEQGFQSYVREARLRCHRAGGILVWRPTGSHKLRKRDNGPLR